MEILFCIPAIAATFSVVVWTMLRDTVPFDRLPVTKFKMLLESIAFFIPAALAGWISTLLAQFSLEANGKAYSIGVMIVLLISFLIQGFLMIGMGLKEAPKGMGVHDLIALVLGFLAGLLYGAYSILILRWKPPQILYALWNEAPKYIVLGCLTIIALAILLLIARKIWRPPPIRRLRQVEELEAHPILLDKDLERPEVDPGKDLQDHASGQDNTGEDLTK